jgi:hypothetical protein
MHRFPLVPAVKRTFSALLNLIYIFFFFFLHSPLTMTRLVWEGLIKAQRKMKSVNYLNNHHGHGWLVDMSRGY